MPGKRSQIVANPGKGWFERGLKARDCGNLNDAESHLRRSLALRQKILGPEHPVIAQSINHLANVLSEMERREDAELLYRESLAMRNKTLGPEHRDVASSLSNLANILQQTDRPSHAERLYRKSLRLRKKIYGLKHENTAMCLSNIAILMQNTGRPEQAERYFKKALAILAEKLGAEHPLTSYTQASYADFLRMDDRITESLAQARQASRNLHRVLPKQHRYVLWAMQVHKAARNRSIARKKSRQNCPEQAR